VAPEGKASSRQARARLESSIAMQGYVTMADYAGKYPRVDMSSTDRYAGVLQAGKLHAGKYHRTDKTLP
jgi:hypothetical protein